MRIQVHDDLIVDSNCIYSIHRLTTPVTTERRNGDKEASHLLLLRRDHNPDPKSPCRFFITEQEFQNLKQFLIIEEEFQTLKRLSFRT